MNLAKVHRDPVFEAHPSPTVLLDTDFTIRAANGAYLSATGKAEEEVVNVHLFDAFPDNPDDPAADGVANLSRSLERVARSGREHNMFVQRYDILDTLRGVWKKRYWSPLNAPVIEDDRVVALIHRVEDITPLKEDLRRVMEEYRDLMVEGPMTDDHERRFADAARAFTASAAGYEAMVDEVMNLRRALSSRSTIEQAKGIVMAERRCTPDEAFKVLTRLSADTNVRVADVAAALVYKAPGVGGES